MRIARAHDARMRAKDFVYECLQIHGHLSRQYRRSDVNLGRAPLLADDTLTFGEHLNRMQVLGHSDLHDFDDCAGVATNRQCSKADG